jgi:hypothetical protein
MALLNLTGAGSGWPGGRDKNPKHNHQPPKPKPKPKPETGGPFWAAQMGLTAWISRMTGLKRTFQRPKAAGLGKHGKPKLRGAAAGLHRIHSGFTADSQLQGLFLALGPSWPLYSAGQHLTQQSQSASTASTFYISRRLQGRQNSAGAQLQSEASPPENDSIRGTAPGAQAPQVKKNPIPKAAAKANGQRVVFQDCLPAKACHGLSFAALTNPDHT